MKNASIFFLFFIIACQNKNSSTNETNSSGLVELEKFFEGHTLPKYIEDSVLLSEISQFNPNSTWIKIDSNFSYRKIKSNKQDSIESVYCLTIGYYDSKGRFNFFENIPENIYLKETLGFSKKIDSVILSANYNIQLKVKVYSSINSDSNYVSYIDLSFDKITYKTNMQKLKNKLIKFKVFDSISIKSDGLMFLFLKMNYRNIDSIESIIPRIKSLDSHIVCKTPYWFLKEKDLVYYITPL
jgi:hypothetical protein